MNTTVRLFGTTGDGRDVHLIRLQEDDGTYAEFLSYGATIRSLGVRAKDGSVRDVILGFDSMDIYEHSATFGCVIGRFANRIGGGRFTLDGVEYELYKNNGPNTLHGGKEGFHKKVWDFETTACGVVFTLFSPDGDENFPGNMTAKAAYEFRDNALTVTYSAVTDKATVVNLTNHAYFNLMGGGDILSHRLMIDADRYTESDENTLPTGNLAPVAGTALDFTSEKEIGRDIESEWTAPFRGYDFNFVLNDDRTRPAAVAASPDGMLTMSVYTDRPGMQLYTGNFIREIQGKDRTYSRYSGFCLETQVFPDSPNHPEFPNCVLRPGEELCTYTSYRFS